MCFLVFSLSVNLLQGTTSRPLRTGYTDIQGRGYLSIDQALVAWERDTYGLIGRTCVPKKPKGLVSLVMLSSHPSQWLPSGNFT